MLLTVNLKLTKRKGETTINFPVAYNTPRNKRIRRDSSPKAKVRRPYKERKKVFRKKVYLLKFCKLNKDY